jgi:acyl-CoA dehydrogenase
MESAGLVDRTAAFVDSDVVPVEDEFDGDVEAAGGDELRLRLQAAARERGIFAPHGPVDCGGLGLGMVDRSPVFEAAGRSLFGPMALNVHAPDEGNMHLLEAVASPAQRERWLRPLAAGSIRSCFCMTEPDPGAGSDPAMLQTRALRDGDDYLISGRKWFITGADGAAFAIIMARLEDGRATMFLADMDRRGITVERSMAAMDSCFPGGHGVVRFDQLRVPTADILGEPGEGFKHAQVRLSPARLTHCMRWLGAARRAHDTAVAYACRRRAFGKLLAEHEGVGFGLADNEMDLHVTRLAVWHAAWVLDQGRLGLTESSQCKVIASEAIWRVVDRSVQFLGGQGVTGETVVARIFADVRAFRIYDGPSEVHRWSLAKRILKNGIAGGTA